MTTDAANGATAAQAVSAAAEPRSPMDADPPARPGRAWSDLGPRVLSAAALIPAALWCAWAGGPWLAGATGAAVVIMSFEWARMSAPKRLGVSWALTFVGAFGGVVLASWGAMTWAWLWLFGWSLLSAVFAERGVGRLEQALGALYVGVPPALFLWLRSHDPGGVVVILGLFVIMWSADMAGYFAGRLIGGPRVAPAISPHKTWAGVLAGFFAGGLAGVGCGFAFGGPLLVWGTAGVTLAVVGLSGDLLESLVKRRFGVKDASRIIPGHGGMLDRLDGLITATLVTALALWAMPQLLILLLGGKP
ncbi:MAG: phosphatidate cytidylyltransferase [Caulobacterales bacterium]